MKVDVVVFKSDGTVSEAEVDLGALCSDAFDNIEDGGDVDIAESDYEVCVACSDLELLIRSTPLDAEFEITLKPTADVALQSIQLRAHFTATDALVYDAGTCTNSFASVLTADTPINLSRDIFMCRSGNSCCNMAFTTAERFYTYFLYDGSGTVSAVYNMEDRVVCAGEIYTLEHIMIDDCLSAQTFFDAYAFTLAANNGMSPIAFDSVMRRKTPCGWSSWSCVYNDVREQQIIKQSELLSQYFGDKGATIVQIDDGWQKGGSFAAFWTEDEERIPSGLQAVRKRLSELNLSLGLWLAPALVSSSSPRYAELSDCVNRVGDEAVPCFSDVVPLNIGRADVVAETCDCIDRAVRKYGACYLKLDFLVNLLMRAGKDSSPVTYKADYSVALYRRLVRSIREAAGDDTFLLACGAPIGESVGVFDAMRASPDITWGGASEPSHIGAWNIIKKDIHNIVRRASYHNMVMQNDPDGVVLRGTLSTYGDDGLALSGDEALLWATTVAFSGGAVLLNELIELLPPDRVDMFADIIPPYGKAARAFDFWEYPNITHTVVDVDNKSVQSSIHILYNWGDEKTTYQFSNNAQGMQQSMYIDCHTKELITVSRTPISIEVAPHACRAILVKAMEVHSFFLYSDENIYLGAGTVRDRYYGQTLYIENTAPLRSSQYFYVPYGINDDIVMNGQTISLTHLSMSEDVGGGKIYRYERKVM